MKLFCQKWKRTINSNTNRIQNQHIEMEFGTEKFAILLIKSGKREKKKTEGIDLPNKKRIRMLGKKENYKYLGILQADTIKQRWRKKNK